jgi:carboxymethylenebutenolidase
MSFYRGMTCENFTINGDEGTPITAYVARLSGPSSFPGVVLIHHLPGRSELQSAVCLAASPRTHARPQDSQL